MRIVVLRPVAGVVLGIQDKRRALLPPAGRAPRSMWFDFDVRVDAASPSRPDFLGPFVHGPRGGRFVYVNAGVRAGQEDSPWDRRAKVPLAIPPSLALRARGQPALLLAAAIAGEDDDGGPACATVALASDWRIVRRGPRRGVARP